MAFSDDIIVKSGQATEKYTGDLATISTLNSSSSGSSTSQSTDRRDESKQESNHTRRRTKTEPRGSSNTALRFLEHSEPPTQTEISSPTTKRKIKNSASPWPAGSARRQAEAASTPAAARARAWTLQSQSLTMPPTNNNGTAAARPRQQPPLPRNRNSPLSFLERRTSTAILNRNHSNLSVSTIGTGAGADAGLSGVVVAAVGSQMNRSGFLPQPRDGYDYDGGWLSGSDDGEDGDEDDNVCPSMLFSCLPCLACLRSGKRQRRPSGIGFLDGGNGNAFKGISNRSRSQTSLTTPLLSEHQHPPLTPEFPKDIKLIEVEVESAKNVPLAGRGVDIAGLAGTYVSLQMVPVQKGVGEQTKQTSVATKFLNPRWGSRETFTFFVTDTDTKAFLSVHLLSRPLRARRHKPLPSRPSQRGGSRSSAASIASEANRVPLPSGSLLGDVVIGEGVVDLLGLFPMHHGTYTPDMLKGNSRRVAVPLWEPEGKRRTACSVLLGVRCRRVNETINTFEDRVYEYERWSQVAGWNPTGSRRVGKWSTLDGTIFSDDFSDIARPAQGESEVVLPWCPFGGWEYSRQEETSTAFPPPLAGFPQLKSNPIPKSSPYPSPAYANEPHDEGWENFAVGQKGSVWMEGYVSGYQAVRRRVWRRVCIDKELPPSLPLSSSLLPSEESNPPPHLNPDIEVGSSPELDSNAEMKVEILSNP